MRPRLARGLADIPYVDVRDRLVEIVWRPLTHPWLPTWAAVKAFEPNGQTDYYLTWFVLSAVLYAVGDDVRAWLAERSDDPRNPPDQ